MPYINQDRRGELINYGQWPDPETPGELNYVLTNIINFYMKRHGPAIGYFKINEVVGVLECAKMELYRRVAAPYEDQKKLENGDVYT